MGCDRCLLTCIVLYCIVLHHLPLNLVSFQPGLDAHQLDRHHAKDGPLTKCGSLMKFSQLRAAFLHLDFTCCRTVLHSIFVASCRCVSLRDGIHFLEGEGTQKKAPSTRKAICMESWLSAPSSTMICQVFRSHTQANISVRHARNVKTNLCIPEARRLPSFLKHRLMQLLSCVVPVQGSKSFAATFCLGPGGWEIYL